MCQHTPDFPSSDAADACKAHVRTPHPEQGWYLLCNGVIFFEDGGAILPNGAVLGNRRSHQAAFSSEGLPASSRTMR
jgi:hypothetical protein